MSDQGVLMVPAFVDIADADHKQWRADGVPGTPVDGMFAFGDDFASARKAFASMVFAAVQGGVFDGIDAADVAAVRVLATTRKTFVAADLV